MFRTFAKGEKFKTTVASAFIELTEALEGCVVCVWVGVVGVVWECCGVSAGSVCECGESGVRCVALVVHAPSVCACVCVLVYCSVVCVVFWAHVG